GVEVINARPAFRLPIAVAADRGAPVVVEVDRIFGAQIDRPARRVGQFVAAEVSQQPSSAVQFRIVVEVESFVEKRIERKRCTQNATHAAAQNRIRTASRRSSPMFNNVYRQDTIGGEL